MIVENHSWDKDGEIVPVFIEPSSDIYDQLPQIKNASFPQAESTIVGYAQRVYDGGDYQHIGLTFTIWETSGRIAYRGEVLMNNSGDVMETMLTPIGTFASPIPGFTKIANQYDLALSAGSLMIVNFNYEVINSTAMFIDAELRSSAGPNADIRSVAIPVTFFNPVQAATLMDLNTRSIASGTSSFNETSPAHKVAPTAIPPEDAPLLIYLLLYIAISRKLGLFTYVGSGTLITSNWKFIPRIPVAPVITDEQKSLMAPGAPSLPMSRFV